MLTRLDRYLLREAAVTFTAVTGVLLVILLSNQLARILGQAAQADLSGRIVLVLVGLTTLQQLTILLPVGLFLGIVLALGRLYHESEMTAVGACGIGPLAIYRPVVLLAVVVAVVLALLSFRVVPAAGARAQQIRIEALRVAQFGALEPGRFRSFAGGDAVFYAERIDRAGKLYGVFVQRRSEDRIELAVAKRAEQRGAGQTEQEFVLYDGRRYEGVPRLARVASGRIPGAWHPGTAAGVQGSEGALRAQADRGTARLGRGTGTRGARLAGCGAHHGARADDVSGSARKAAPTAGTLRAHRVRDSRLLSIFESARGSARLDGKGFCGRRAGIVVGAPAAARRHGRDALGRGTSRLVASGERAAAA